MHTDEAGACTSEGVMRALLVDDERLALMRLQNLLECEIGGVQVVGACADPLEVVDLTVQLQPDVVFLDIQLPEISGLEMGAQLQMAAPGVQIVFVTAHRQYAMEAFELRALDYLMKPVLPQRLRKTVARVRSSLSKAEPGSCRT